VRRNVTDAEAIVLAIKDFTDATITAQTAARKMVCDSLADLRAEIRTLNRLLAIGLYEDNMERSTKETAAMSSDVRQVLGFNLPSD
jgi:hypothetical protein